ncbi:MAG: DUF996 domain-containing protein [Nitrososphaerota archaeon]|jgi:uncharacterized membrane protein|nr:DUF996 domain-containing protein [Nitrososphaerota archaeon]
MSNDTNPSTRLARIGSTLLLIPALNLVGLILVHIGMKGFAKHYNNDSIYRKAAVGTAFGMIGLIVMDVSVIFTFIVYIFASVPADSATSIVFVPFALGVIVTFGFISLMALCYRIAFHSLADCSNEPLFNVAGNIFLIGAVLPVLCNILFFVLIPILQIELNPIIPIIVLFSGLITVCIAFIIMAIAFSSLKQTR